MRTDEVVSVNLEVTLPFACCVPAGVVFMMAC
jgi:hypothetical protein